MKTRSHSHGWGRFGRLCLEPRILAVVFCVAVMAPFAGTQAFSTSTIAANEERHATRQSELRQRLLRERREAASRKQGMGAFQSKKGVILTNRPEKYRNRAGYHEIALEYDPIVIPDRFRNRTTPASYSTGDIGELVQRYARQYNVNESLIYAIIKVESNGNPNAVSPKGARGLMQLMPATAEDMGVKNIHDPAENIAGGTQYIAKLLELFDNDPVFALAGYNAGPENVKKWGGVPPFEETQNYVNKVLRLSQKYSKSGVDASYLDRSFVKAKLPASSKETKQVAAVRREDPKQKYQVKFKSGTVQQAEKVVEEDDYYYIDYQGRSFRVRKGLVDTVTPAPPSRQAGTRLTSQM